MDGQTFDEEGSCLFVKGVYLFEQRGEMWTMGCLGIWVRSNSRTFSFISHLWNVWLLLVRRWAVRNRMTQMWCTSVAHCWWKLIAGFVHDHSIHSRIMIWVINTGKCSLLIRPVACKATWMKSETSCPNWAGKPCMVFSCTPLSSSGYSTELRWTLRSCSGYSTEFRCTLRSCSGYSTEFRCTTYIARQFRL
jgi:hypothetical protein